MVFLASQGQPAFPQHLEIPGGRISSRVVPREEYPNHLLPSAAAVENYTKQSLRLETGENLTPMEGMINMYFVHDLIESPRIHFKMHVTSWLCSFSRVYHLRLHLDIVIEC